MLAFLVITLLLAAVLPTGLIILAFAVETTEVILFLVIEYIQEYKVVKNNPVNDKVSRALFTSLNKLNFMVVRYNDRGERTYCALTEKLVFCWVIVLVLVLAISTGSFILGTIFFLCVVAFLWRNYYKYKSVGSNDKDSEILETINEEGE